MHFVTQQQRQQQQQSQQQQQQQQKLIATTTTAGTRFGTLCKSASQGALPKSLATLNQNLYRQQQEQQQHKQKHKRAASLNLNLSPMIKDIDITTTTTTAATTNAVSSIEPVHDIMIADAQQELPQQQQQQQLQQQQSLEHAQQQQQQQQQLLEADQDDKAQTISLGNGDRRDSITEEITITTTTSSKLLTIQEASGTLERNSSLSISTSLSSIHNTSTGLVTAATSAQQQQQQQQQRRESVGSNSSNGNPNNSSNNSNVATNPQSTAPSQTPSIQISQSETREQQQQQQPLQSHSVDSNGFGAQPALGGGSCTDSPSSRKSSTGSKSKSSKLSTTSSIGTEDAQQKLTETAANTESHFVRGVDNSSGAAGNQQVSSSSILNEKPAKCTSRLSERAKKKSWYNVIYPNYKSRAEDFKKLFKEVPNDERLIVDYSCALQRDILVQGRLYVSQNYVCFHANIFSWETYVSIKWKDVTTITKEKTALVIPNAISISTEKEKFFFATFASRDKSFLMLFRVWQNTLMNKPFSPQEIWRYVHNSYGEELGLTTDDEDYIDPTLDVDTETDGDFHTGDDFAGEQGNTSQSISNPALLQQSGNSSASSGGGSTATRKSKTKYFFNSSKSSNLNSSANASASGSDNKASDNTRKSNKKMKANAKELTLSSVKAAEQTVAVTFSTPSTSSISGSLTSSSTITTAANTATTNATASGSSSGERKADKSSSHAANVSTASEINHGPETKRKLIKNQRQREVELAAKIDEAGPTDVSDSSDSEENNVPFVPTTECTSTHEGRQIVHTILPISVDTLFNLLFSKSKFLTDLHDFRKSTDLIMGEWQTNEEGQNVRMVNVTVQLAASVGPKTSKVTEYQTMRECSKPGELYSIDVNSVNAGIPYADSFSVLIHFCLARTVDNHTMMSVHAQIKYKKSIWGVVKGFIEKNTWAGLEDFYSAQLHALQSETCIPPAKGKGRRPRRGPKQLQLVKASNSTDNDKGQATSFQQLQHSHHQHHSQQQQQHHPLQHHPPQHLQQHQHLHHHHHQRRHLPHTNPPTQSLAKPHRRAKLHACKGTATQIRPTEEASSCGTAQASKSDTLLDNWDAKLLSASGAGNVAGLGHGLHASGIGGNPNSRQQQLLAAQQQQQQLLAGGQQLGMGLGPNQDRFKHKGLSLFVILLMCLLLALNVILLLKLWKLEEHIDVDLSRRARLPSLAALKELPDTNQDWLELLRQQELSHESELRKWHQVLQTAIELLKKTEKTLAEVMIP